MDRNKDFLIGLAFALNALDQSFQKHGDFIIIMTSEGFYVVLPRTSTSYNSKTRPGNYRVDFPEQLNFGGPWKVALMAISFPAAFKPKSQTDEVIFKMDGTTYGPLKLTHFFETAGELFQAVCWTNKKPEQNFHTTDGNITFGCNFYLAHTLRLVTINSSSYLRYGDTLQQEGDFVFIKPGKTL